MPNWALGTVFTTGTKAEVTAFSQRFLDTKKSEFPLSTKHFYRAFLDYERKFVMQDIEESFANVPENTRGELVLYVNFAWSAYSCLLELQGLTDEKDLINLDVACKEDHVSVRIEAHESDEGFEEEITCSETGELSYTVKDMARIKCKHCGTILNMPSFEALDDFTCPKCNREDFTLYKDEEE